MGAALLLKVYPLSLRRTNSSRIYDPATCKNKIPSVRVRRDWYVENETWLREFLVELVKNKLWPTKGYGAGAHNTIGFSLNTGERCELSRPPGHGLSMAILNV